MFIYNLLLSAEKIAHVGERISAPPSVLEDHCGAVLRYCTVGHIVFYSVWITEDNVIISTGFLSTPLNVLKIIRLFQIVFVLHRGWVVKTLRLEKAAFATQVAEVGNSCSPWMSHRIPFFGRADVIWKLHSRVNAVSCSPPVLAESSLVSDGHTSGRNQTSPERQINPAKPRTSDPETKRPDCARAEHQDPEPRFLWAKASWTFSSGGLYKNCNHQNESKFSQVAASPERGLQRRGSQKQGECQGFELEVLVVHRHQNPSDEEFHMLLR